MGTTLRSPSPAELLRRQRHPSSLSSRTDLSIMPSSSGRAVRGAGRTYNIVPVAGGVLRARCEREDENPLSTSSSRCSETATPTGEELSRKLPRKTIRMFETETERCPLPRGSPSLSLANQITPDRIVPPPRPPARQERKTTDTTQNNSTIPARLRTIDPPRPTERELLVENFFEEIELELRECRPTLHSLTSLTEGPHVGRW